MDQPADPIDLMLVEDHEEYRKSLEFLLNSAPEFKCVGHANAEEAIEAMYRDLPDIVIMDINLPGQSGINATRTIRDKWPEVQVMICTVYEDDEKIFGALKAGANGYLLKRAPIEELFDAIKQLQQGGSPMSAGIARKVVSSFQRPLSTAAQQLTDREQEVLDLLAEGLRVKEIADRANVSVSTVRTHIRHIYEKLQVQTRVEALNKARRGHF
ncbi:MAG TPA: response regulator transcription factor [Flavobacteriales bacterium]|jgi:RNA polymerase sigma factor (sigma-70 family)|nr:response regulator transcription factor [Flavobacteriales bacterium]